jgi:hypothetical protein
MPGSQNVAVTASIPDQPGGPSAHADYEQKLKDWREAFRLAMDAEAALQGVISRMSEDTVASRRISAARLRVRADKLLAALVASQRNSPRRMG